MKSIIIGFSKPKAWFSPFSWLIRFVERTPYSHVYIRFFSDTFARNIVYQASGRAVNFMGWNLFISKEYSIEEFELSIEDDSHRAMMQYCIDEAGVPYGVLSIFGIGYRLFMGLLNKTVGNPFPSGDASFFCSKLAENIINKFSDQKIPLNPESVLPKDIYTYLESRRGPVA